MTFDLYFMLSGLMSQGHAIGRMQHGVRGESMFGTMQWGVEVSKAFVTNKGQPRTAGYIENERQSQ